MSASSKQRTTCTMASTSRMCVRNLLPRPSPWLAPLTSPAMSTNSIAAGMMTVVLAIFCSSSSRASGTVTMPTFGIDGAEGIVRRLRFARAGDGVEQGGLADVGQTDDSSSQHDCVLPHSFYFQTHDHPGRSPGQPTDTCHSLRAVLSNPERQNATRTTGAV